MTVRSPGRCARTRASNAVRVNVGDTPITIAGEGPDFDVEIGQAYDPSGVYSVQDLFGLRNRRLVTSVNGREERVGGPFGQDDYTLRDFSVNLPGTEVAGVTRDGSAPAARPGGRRPGPRGPAAGRPARPTCSTPAWDHSDRLWVLDRTAAGAQISYIVGNRRVPVRVPGITGEPVIDFLVSRDGSRFAAAIDRPGSDVVVLSRIVRRDSSVRGHPGRDHPARGGGAAADPRPRLALADRDRDGQRADRRAVGGADVLGGRLALDPVRGRADRADPGGHRPAGQLAAAGAVQLGGLRERGRHPARARARRDAAAGRHPGPHVRRLTLPSTGRPDRGCGPAAPGVG